MRFFKLRIGGRLTAGFVAVCAVLAAAVGYTVFVVGGVSTTVDRMVNLRTPVALMSTEIVGSLYSTLASLRGYLLTGNAQGKADRAAVWKELETSVAVFDSMAERFTNPENRRKWAEAKSIIAEFRTAQDKAEAIAFTPEAFPATKLLRTEAMARFNIMAAELRKMIDEEDRLEATSERKRLLKAMADLRANLTAAVAQLRMFLLTAEKADKDQFATFRDDFERTLASVSAQRAFLSTTQKLSFEAFGKAYEEFKPLSERIVAIRESAEHNMPVHILVTEAAPRALKILDLLDGPKQADGTRSGGIKTNQKANLESEARSASEGMSFLALVQWILLASGLGIGALIAFFTSRSIAVPIRSMTDTMRRLAGGDSTVEIVGLKRADEIGAMASAVQVFKENLIETERLRAEQAEAEKRAAEEKRAAMHKLANDFQLAVGGIIETVSSASTELEAAANTLTHTAETSQQLAGMVAAASEEASSNVQSVASASEEMASSINEISRQVQESSRIASEAVKQAEKTDTRINELSQAASRIGDVVKLITAIAEQTNLLALNATIEAARAGEAGRGFAVVAQEVKALAAQTAKATDEISAQIAGMQTATADSVAAIKEIGGTIDRISEIAATIAAAVEEQGAATQEIARNVQQASQGTSQVAQNISEVNKGATETGSASAQVLSSAQSLSSESSRLKIEVDKFLNTVRAA